MDWKTSRIDVKLHQMHPKMVPSYKWNPFGSNHKICFLFVFCLRKWQLPGPGAGPGYCENPIVKPSTKHLFGYIFATEFFRRRGFRCPPSFWCYFKWAYFRQDLLGKKLKCPRNFDFDSTSSSSGTQVSETTSYQDRFFARMVYHEVITVPFGKTQTSNIALTQRNFLKNCLSKIKFREG